MRRENENSWDKKIWREDGGGRRSSTISISKISAWNGNRGSPGSWFLGGCWVYGTTHQQHHHHLDLASSTKGAGLSSLCSPSKCFSSQESLRLFSEKTDRSQLGIQDLPRVFFSHHISFFLKRPFFGAQNISWDDLNRSEDLQGFLWRRKKQMMWSGLRATVPLEEGRLNIIRVISALPSIPGTLNWHIK